MARCGSAARDQKLSPRSRTGTSFASAILHPSQASTLTARSVIRQRVMAYPSDSNAFHPLLSERREGSHPANEAAGAYLRAEIVSEDLARLWRLVKATTDRYDRRLLFKFFVVEFLSFLDRFDQLLNIANQAPVVGDVAGDLPISEENRKALCQASKLYHREKNKSEKSLREIRNHIGAHRGSITWEEMKRLWDSVNPTTVKPLYDAAMSAFGITACLPIYEWVRINADSSFNYAMPLPPGLFENGSE